MTIALLALVLGACTFTSEKDDEAGAEAAASAKADGAVVISYPDGGRYEGHLRNGKRHGQGTYYYPTGDSYSGNWVNNLRNGWGTYRWANGAKFDGEWRNGRQHGQGTLTYADGGVLQASWSNGRMLAAGETMAPAEAPAQMNRAQPRQGNAGNTQPRRNQNPPPAPKPEPRQLTCADTSELWLQPEPDPKWLQTVESLNIKLEGQDCNYISEQSGSEGFTTPSRQAHFTGVGPGKYNLVIEGTDRNSGPFSIKVQLNHPGPATLRCTLNVSGGNFSCR